MLTSAQLRAARAMLRMEQTDLARYAGVSVETIKRLEALPGQLRAQSDTLDSVKKALEMSGIEFLENDVVGIRLKEDRNETFIAEVVKHASDLLTVALKTEFGTETPAITEGVDEAIDRVIETTNKFLRRRLSVVIAGQIEDRARKNTSPTRLKVNTN